MGPTQMSNWNQFAEPPTHAQPQPQQPQAQPNGGGSSSRKKLGKLLQGPYSGPAGASVSGFFGGGSSSREEDKRKKVQKKRSVHF
jgi:hypothetical protein